MKVALVHDWMNQVGGAEYVLETLVDLYPGAPIYTSMYAPALMPPAYRQWDIRTSFLDRLPLVKRHHQPFLPLYPLAFESFDFSGHDLVVSNKSGFCHGVPIPEVAVDASGLEPELLTQDEPDEPALSKVSDEWAELIAEDPLEVLESPVVAYEMTDDPVRLYLKEIGLISLLDADSEFRLSARIEAERRLSKLLQSLKKKTTRTIPLEEYYEALIRQLVDAWKTARKAAETVGEENLPDMSLALSEAQMLREWAGDAAPVPAQAGKEA